MAAEFWSVALGYSVDKTWAEGDDEGALIVDPVAVRPSIAFVKVPEPKIAKNRIHFDITPRQTQAEEVERLESMGARVVEGYAPQGATWIVMTDPEGNEFCVLPGAEDATPGET